jgi:hypothetical protein
VLQPCSTDQEAVNAVLPPRGFAIIGQVDDNEVQLCVQTGEGQDVVTSPCDQTEPPDKTGKIIFSCYLQELEG